MGVIEATGLANDVPVGVPLIGYENLVTAGNITSTTATAGNPATNLANNATHLKWQGGVNTGDEFVTITLGNITLANYLGVAKHNFGSGGCIASVEGLDANQVLLHFNGGSLSPPNNIVDNNTVGSVHAWLPSGNATQDTTNKRFGISSLLCDGTGDLVSTPASPDFNLGSSDFTIDCWFNCNAAGSIGRNLIGQYNGTASASSFVLYRDATNVINFLISNGGSFVAVSGTTQFTNAVNTGWHHVAIVRTSDVLKLFIDGIQEGSSTAFASIVPNSALALQVGDVNSGGSWLGWIDEVRMLVGYARWTSNFSIPTLETGFAPLVQEMSDSSILLHFDGVDAATVFTDSNTVGSDHTWTAGGTAQIDNAQSKFGGTSLLLTPNSWIETPDANEFHLDTMDFTIDFWFRLNGGDGTDMIFVGQTDSGFSVASRTFYIQRNSSNQVAWQVTGIGGVGGQSGNGATTVTVASMGGTFHHVALVRSGSTFTLYLDGAVQSTASFSGAVNTAPNKISIGRPGENAAQFFNGWIDEFRFTVGVARWTSVFTPPLAPSSEVSAITDDSPLIFRWAPTPIAGVRLHLRPNVTPPQAAVIYLGRLLVLERSIKVDVDHVPITYGRQTDVVNGMSESGNFLGRILLKEYRESKAEFAWFTPTFFRTNIDPFIIAAKTNPFFWAWSPEEYPNETGYVWLINDVAPAVHPVTRRVALTLEMRGVA